MSCATCSCTIFSVQHFLYNIVGTIFSCRIFPMQCFPVQCFALQHFLYIVFFTIFSAQMSSTVFSCAIPPVQHFACNICLQSFRYSIFLHENKRLPISREALYVMLIWAVWAYGHTFPISIVSKYCIVACHSGFDMKGS